MQIYPDTLTLNSVSIQSDEYGVRAYVNSARGRAQLEAECPTDIVQTIEAAWGATPTVIETEPPAIADPQPTEQDKINAEMMMQIAQLKAAVGT